MTTVKTCLSQKSGRLIHVSPEDSVQRALELMKENRVRSVLALEGDRLVGIITQGDCAIRVLLPGLDARTTLVSQIMTRDPMTVKPGDPLEACMGLMASRNFRHLPVLDEGRVVGVVSIGDIVKDMIRQLGDQVSFLETYIKGHGA
ncbi:MAG: CBS domain-containing protein [Rubrivivax sp.]